MVFTYGVAAPAAATRCAARVRSSAASRKGARSGPSARDQRVERLDPLAVSTGSASAALGRGSRRCGGRARGRSWLHSDRGVDLATIHPWAFHPCSAAAPGRTPGRTWTCGPSTATGVPRRTSGDPYLALYQRARAARRRRTTTSPSRTGCYTLVQMVDAGRPGASPARATSPSAAAGKGRSTYMIAEPAARRRLDRVASSSSTASRAASPTRSPAPTARAAATPDPERDARSRSCRFACDYQAQVAALLRPFGFVSAAQGLDPGRLPDTVPGPGASAASRWSTSTSTCTTPRATALGVLRPAHGRQAASDRHRRLRRGQLSRQSRHRGRRVHGATQEAEVLPSRVI